MHARTAPLYQAWNGGLLDLITNVAADEPVERAVVNLTDFALGVAGLIQVDDHGAAEGDVASHGVTNEGALFTLHLSLEGLLHIVVGDELALDGDGVEGVLPLGLLVEVDSEDGVASLVKLINELRASHLTGLENAMSRAAFGENDFTTDGPLSALLVHDGDGRGIHCADLHVGDSGETNAEGEVFAQNLGIDRGRGGGFGWDFGGGGWFHLFCVLEVPNRRAK